MKKRQWIVITTINSPTRTIAHVARLCRRGWGAVVVGDVSTPADWNAEGVIFLSTDRQKKLFDDVADLIPYRHYSRKNLGYLYAIAAGADHVLETDDDNIPYPSFAKQLSRTARGRYVRSDGWVNVYKYFTDATIWPRGLPLDELASVGDMQTAATDAVCPIQQFLCDHDPDVDAIYRLINKDPVVFDPAAASVILSENAWCPFNSQNTLFFSEAFPLLYLPCHVSFRMTDIWRSFVAQATLWAHGYRVAFHTSTAKQIRNPHDLMEDFKQEIVGYTDNKRICAALSDACANLTDEDSSNISRTAQALWRKLVEEQVIPPTEIPIITAWFNHVDALMGKVAAQ